MGYLFLLLTILFETASVLLMKLSAGFEHKTYTIFALLTYAATFLFLTLALKTLPAGIANGIWAGASTILIAIISILLFKEKLNAIQYVSIALIAIGLIGLNVGK